MIVPYLDDFVTVVHQNAASVTDHSTVRSISIDSRRRAVPVPDSPEVNDIVEYGPVGRQLVPFNDADNHLAPGVSSPSTPSQNVNAAPLPLASVGTVVPADADDPITIYQTPPAIYAKVMRR